MPGTNWAPNWARTNWALAIGQHSAGPGDREDARNPRYAKALTKFFHGYLVVTTALAPLPAAKGEPATGVSAPVVALIVYAVTSWEERFPT